MKLQKILCVMIFYLLFSQASLAAMTEIQDFDAQPKMTEIYLKWKKVSLSEVESVVIRRKIDACPENQFDGQEIYRGNGSGFGDKDVEKEKSYCYGIFIYDFSGNYSQMQKSQMVQKITLKKAITDLISHNAFIFGGLIVIVFLLWLKEKRKRKLLLLIH